MCDRTWPSSATGVTIPEDYEDDVTGYDMVPPELSPEAMGQPQHILWVQMTLPVIDKEVPK